MAIRNAAHVPGKVYVSLVEQLIGMFLPASLLVTIAENLLPRISPSTGTPSTSILKRFSKVKYATLWERTSQPIANITTRTVRAESRNHLFVMLDIGRWCWINCSVAKQDVGGRSARSTPDLSANRKGGS